MNKRQPTPPAPLARGEQKKTLRSATRLLKFGGTSMGTAESISRVADIVMAVSGPCCAVVSATSGTTDRLIEFANTALSGGDWENIFREIVERHEGILDELGLRGPGPGTEMPRQKGLNLQPYFENLYKVASGISLIRDLSLSARDRVMTFGERISCQILAALLDSRGVKSEPVDAYEIVFTDNNFGEGNVDFARTNEAVAKRLTPLLGSGVIPIVTGFVGRSENGHYITLGRGGSDYTGAILAAALNADELQIWTDVDGILNADPRLMPEAKVLARLSFAEAGELAYFGAKVLHPKTIKPAIEKNIPVKILNTFNPSAPGTLITIDEEESIKSVTYKKGISIINVCSAGMLEARGFLAKLFEVFARHQVSVDVVSTSEVSVSLTVDSNIPDVVIRELSEFARVEVYKNMAIVCLVGEGIKTKSGILGRLFSAISEHNVNMVSQGASKRNITFLVNEAEAADVVKKIFNTFFKSLTPES